MVKALIKRKDKPVFSDGTYPWKDGKRTYMYNVNFVLYSNDLLWRPRLVMMSTLSSLVAQRFVIMTTCGDASNGKVGIMPTRGFQCLTRLAKWPS